MRLQTFVLPLLFACTAEPGAEGAGELVDTALPNDSTHEAAYCGTGAPEWGHVTYDVFYGESGPQLTVFALPFDPDGGLYDVELQLWGDHEVDGSVNLITEPRASQRLVHGEPACGPAAGEAVLWGLLLPDHGFREGGAELALRMVDADGNPSEFLYVDLCLWGSDEGCAEE